MATASCWNHWELESFITRWATVTDVTFTDAVWVYSIVVWVYSIVVWVYPIVVCVLYFCVRVLNCCVSVLNCVSVIYYVCVLYCCVSVLCCCVSVLYCCVCVLYCCVSVLYYCVSVLNSHRSYGCSWPLSCCTVGSVCPSSSPFTCSYVPQRLCLCPSLLLYTCHMASTVPSEAVI